ncbi:hypothetical protein BC937DRAFT_88055 [Endogone sp. FLAS-F59071]|nr:hypothetical protein BC937DRAFT_88055 [Endogone sp. FLAS-F59071]|eukprot:RUS19034.1 hypothetical protein BC937DRAFT_88055 [Endogone sp. FLAS-F59071]
MMCRVPKERKPVTQCRDDDCISTTEFPLLLAPPMLQLPHVTIQHDWHSVVSDVARAPLSSEAFWISVYRKGEQATSIHSSVNVYNANSSHIGLTSENGVEVTLVNQQKTIRISCPVLNIFDVTVHAPRAAYKLTDSVTRIPKPVRLDSRFIALYYRACVMLLNKSCHTFGLPAQPLFLLNVGISDQQYRRFSRRRALRELKIGELDGGAVRRELKGHFGDITTCRFFPSGQVVLSGASDFQLRIWSALDGSNPVTLMGHTAGITDTAVIGRGKNILCSATTISTFGNYSIPVNKVALGTAPSTLRGDDDGTVELDPREVETQDKFILAAVDDGTLRGIDLRNKVEVFVTPKKGTASLACAYAPQWNLAVLGDAKGIIDLFDVRNVSKPLITFHRNGHPIQDVIISTNDKKEPVLFVATGDGAAYQTSPLISTSSLRVTHEYSGFDVDPIANLRLVGGGGQSNLATLNGRGLKHSKTALYLSIMSSYLTLAASYLPPGNLPPWLLFTSFLSVFNTVQNYSTTALTKQVYGAKSDEDGNFNVRYRALTFLGRVSDFQDSQGEHGIHVPLYRCWYVFPFPRNKRYLCKVRSKLVMKYIGSLRISITATNCFVIRRPCV